jgi:MFS family permease
MVSTLRAGFGLNPECVLTYLAEFKFPDEASRGLLNAIMSVGSICALPVVPYTADILGRRWGIIIGCTIMILGVVLQSIGINLKLLTASRFLVGFGVAIAHGASPLLVAELVHPQHRAIYTTIYNCTWYFGSIIAAWTAFGTDKLGPTNNWAWRIPTILQALPSCLQMIFIWYVYRKFSGTHFSLRYTC